MAILQEQVQVEVVGCQDIREEREDHGMCEDEMAPDFNINGPNIVESNAADVNEIVCVDEGGPHMQSDVSDGLTQVTDVDAPIPVSQSSHVNEADANQTKPEKPAPIQLPDVQNIPVSMAAMHLKDDIADKKTKASTIPPVQIANEEYHPIPVQFIQADAAIQKDAAFQSPPRSFDTLTIIDDVSPVPPSANIHAADKVLPPRRVDDEIEVDPEQTQMQAEEGNSASFNQQEDPTYPVNNLSTQQENTTESDILIPEAFLVDEIPSAEIVPTEKYSVIIAGRKIHIGFLALAVFILISVIVGVSIYATTNSNTNTLTKDATLAKNNTVARVKNITNELERLVLPRYNSFSELPSSDARNYALDWIIYEDPLKLSASDSNLHQRYILALLGLHYELDLSEHRSSDDRPWMSEENECFWHGVSCHDGKVNEINFNGLGLRGTLPPEIGELQLLERFDLYQNSLTGSLPSEICSLPNLTYLDLGYNSLTGSLPSEIGSLLKLTVLDLWSNSLTGSLPSKIGSLLNLSELNLGQNSLTSSLPSEIGRLRNLTYLDLRENSFTGSLPSEIGSLHNLTKLDLGENSFTSNLPSEIGNLRNLIELELGGSSLTGNLPSEFGILHSLTRFSLYGNSLTGSLPSEIGRLRNLTYLDLYQNSFTGSLPSEIGSLNNLDYISLGENSLTGSLPSEIGSLGSVTFLGLWKNSLTGSLPSEIGSLQNLNELELGHNDLTGSLPSEIGDLILANLHFVDISDNKFTGIFPDSIAKNVMAKVEEEDDYFYNAPMFCFSNNLFTGDVPDDTEYCGMW